MVRAAMQAIGASATILPASAQVLNAPPAPSAGTPEPKGPTTSTPEDRERRLKWWREARFGRSVSFALADAPCGQGAGWSRDESKAFGLMQLAPACGWLFSARLADGHPNLTTDTRDPLWETSVFNPVLNIGEVVRATSVARAKMVQAFPGCTEDDYTLMAVAIFHSGVPSLGCRTYSPSAESYVSAMLRSYQRFAGEAGWAKRY